jgi:DNA-binding NarL/FixJ family response regulator
MKTTRTTSAALRRTTDASAAVTVFIVDDHELVRDGLRALLRGEPDIEVVGEAATAADAVPSILATVPDVVLLDLNLGDSSGIDVCRAVRSERPEINVLVLTSVADDDALLAAILAGASGYVLKHVRAGELLSSIRSAAGGGSLLDQRTRAQVLERLEHPDRADDGPGGLSGQEQRVLDLLAQGLTNRQIADELGLAEKTVKNYVSNLLAKLGMHRRTEAAVYAAALAERRRTDRRSDSGAAIKY